MKRAKEKIAIVGMAFRFPGELNTSAAFWDALAEQQDLVSEIGPERWDSSLFYHPDQTVPGKSYIFAAGTISDIDQFDAQFFGISPREAAQMDPQQRILLELSWQALADGRQRVDKLEGSNCAVYIGIASSDYANRAIDDLAAADAYTMTGNTGSIASNRISYNFNLKGPSVSVDTACSSSLVAVYEACKSIWAGEADCAITGGVNLLLHPSPFIGFSKASMLSPTGRCKPFDASADGYVRSEGAGVLFLKPLADAERDGDPIHAVIVNAGVNSDGRTPSGISVPDQAGQAALLDKLYRQDAAFNLNDLDYIEAHGTGTPVGDPIEAASLGQVLGQRRSHNHALPIGSIKGNLGHLETASGMAGIIKVIHCLKERAIPPSNLVSGLNSAIDFDALNLQVVTNYTSLADIDRPLKMGVNSFGFGGTNAHVVVEEYQRGLGEEYQRPVGKEHQRGLGEEYQPGVTKKNQPVLNREDSSPELAHKAKLPPLYLTANSDAALDQLRRDYAALIEMHPARYYDVAAYSLSKQSRLARGILLTADTPTNVVKQLRSKVLVNDSSRIYIGKRLAAKPPVVFVYSGNGCQWQGMARKLYANDAVFATYIDQLELRFAPLIDFSIVTQLNASEADSHLHLTDYAQPLLFAIQVALTQWFADKGLVPDYVIGHSVGEVAAAWAADALSLADAITVIVERSRAQSLTRGTGRMAAAAMSLVEANALLEQLKLNSVVEVACHNASESVVFAGALPHLSKVESYCENQTIFYRLLDLDYAFHSRFMDPIEKPLIQSLLDITPKPSSRFISSAVLGSTNPLLVDAEYWWRNIRDQVQFVAAMDTAIERGGRVFIELGSQPILRHYLNSALKDNREVGAVLSTLKRDVDDSDALQECYFQAFLAGAEVGFDDHLPLSAMPVAIPAYPWQRTRHWYSSSVESDSVVERRCVHPLLGRRLNASLPVWEQHIDSQLTDYLADHVVNGAVVLPGAAYIELALAACRDWFGSQSFDLENIDIIAPMVLVADEQRSLRVEIQLARHKFIVSSRSRMSEDQWLEHCSGQINSIVNSAVDGDKNLVNYDQAVKPFWRAHPSLTVSPLESIDASAFYLALADLGLQYGTQFQAIQSLWSDESKSAAFAVIGVDAETKSNAEAKTNDRYILHPVLLDACFQLGALLVDEQEVGCQQTFLPVRVGRLQQFSTAEIVHLSARRIRQTARTLVVDFALCDARGELLAMVTGARFKAIPVVESSIKPEHYAWQAVLAHRDTRGHAFWSKTDDVASAADYGFARWHQALASQASEAFSAPERQRFFREVMPLIDSLIGHAAVEIFSLITDQQQQFSLAEQCLAGVIEAEQRHFFNYLVDVAVQDGFVDKLDGGRFVFTNTAQTRQADTTAIYQLLVDDYPEYIAELLLLASSLGRAKQFFGHHSESTRFNARSDIGSASPISLEHKSSLVSGGGSYLGLQKLSQAAVTSLLAARSEQKNIDLLELANYDSTLAEQVVPQLFANDCFHFCSADNSSVMRLQESLAEHTAFATTYLPSTAEVYKQLTNKRYDIIVLSHFVLSSAQPEKLLAHLQSLLKPAGVLVIIEQSENRFQDFVFGVEPTWWSRSSETSRRSQLISAPALQKYLDKSCQHIAVIYEDEQQCHESAYVLVAQTSDAVDDSELTNDYLAKNITRVEVDSEVDSESESEVEFELGSVAADEIARAKPVYLLLVNEENKLAMLRWWQRCQQADLKQRRHEKIRLNDIELLIASIPSPLSKPANELEDLSPSFIEGLSLADPKQVDDGYEITSGNFSLDSATALDSVEQWQEFWSSLTHKPTKIIDARFSVDIEISSINNACLKNNTALAAQRCDALLVMLQFLQSLGADQLTDANDCRVNVDLLTYRSQSFPADAAVLGMARVAMNELTHLSLRLIDIDDDCLVLSPLLLLDELLLEEGLANGNMAKVLDNRGANPDAKYFTQALDESEILLRAGVRYANRLMPFTQPKEKVEPLLETKKHYNYLGFQAAGQLKNLQWLSRPYRGLGVNQVAVQPKVAGLNFRDVMFATGLLPDEALENGFSGPELGMEFAGVVSEVGAEVKHLVVGDAVMGFAPGCFADHVVTDSFALVKKPDDWSFAAAASVPTVFFTAYYALVELAKLQAGERVLIHGAAGGVGLAAIQIARHLGAEIYATAGSEEKREFIQLLGAERVFDSRSLAFADQIMASTQGEGVDVILNSLAGEAIARNLSILRPFGRFLELGKRDFYADSAMGLRPFRNNISYFGIDADQLMLAHPQLVQSSFRQLLALFYSEELRPIPYRLFPATQVVDAFRYMQRSRQVGKVLIELESLADVVKPAQLPIEKSSAKQLELSADATYLVTGGSSGLGLATADWLVQRGAKHIAIVSRRGMVDIPSMLSRKTWSDQQVNVIDIVLDLAAADSEARLRNALSTCPPLAGIIHAATCIDDALLATLSSDSLNAVLAPKIHGAWILHQLSQAMALDFFVLYSSATTLFGNPGQANYVAANCYLEALSAYRRDLGLPSLCLAWGAIDDVGFLSRNSHLKQALVSRLGGSILNSAQVIAELEAALLNAYEDSSYLALDWSSLNGVLAVSNQAKYHYFNRFADTNQRQDPADLRLRLAALPDDQRSELIYQLLAGQVEKILCLASGEVDIDQSLFEQGMDSLMGVELAAAIETHFSVRIAAMALAEGPTVRRVGDTVLRQMQLSAVQDDDKSLVAARLNDKLNALVSRHGADASDSEYSQIKSNVIRVIGEHYEN